jgi:hypothetical protein
VPSQRIAARREVGRFAGQPPRRFQPPAVVFLAGVRQSIFHLIIRGGIPALVWELQAVIPCPSKGFEGPERGFESRTGRVRCVCQPGVTGHRRGRIREAGWVSNGINGDGEILQERTEQTEKAPRAGRRVVTRRSRRTRRTENNQEGRTPGGDESRGGAEGAEPPSRQALSRAKERRDDKLCCGRFDSASEFQSHCGLTGRGSKKTPHGAELIMSFF